MSKASTETTPEVRFILHQDANLTTGKGLKGAGPFVSGSALSVTQDQEHFIEVASDIKISYFSNHSHQPATIMVRPEVHQLELGSVYTLKDQKGTTEIIIDGPREDNVKLILTGTPDPRYPGSSDIQDNSYKGLIKISPEHKCEIIKKSYNDGIIDISHVLQHEEGAVLLTGSDAGLDAVA